MCVGTCVCVSTYSLFLRYKRSAQQTGLEPGPALTDRVVVVVVVVEEWRD